MIKFILLVLIFGSCSSYYADRLDHYVQKKAAKDFGCELEQVKVSDGSSKETFEAEGCGKKSAYKVDCVHGNVGSCMAVPVK